jgi:hypothetical protein
MSELGHERPPPPKADAAELPSISAAPVHKLGDWDGPTTDIRSLCVQTKPRREAGDLDWYPPTQISARRPLAN